MKILLAGPGTGKTTNIEKIVIDHGDGSKFLVLSFTNATVKDLQISLKEHGVTENNCMTLHKFALKYNHDKSRHILIGNEIDELRTISKGTDIEFDKLCDFLSCTTFDQMIARFVDYAKANPLYLQEKLEDYDSLIVDEYQDFNPNEQALIDILIENMQASYVLGDDDQCIYDFKDASSDKIISFYEDSRNEKIAHEHICHRCPDQVVEHATHLITKNKKRVAKDWKKSGKSGRISYSQHRSFEDVAEAIHNELLKIKGESVLILTPVEFAVKPLVETLGSESIQFRNYFVEKIPFEIIAKAWEVKSIFGKYKYLNLVLLGYLRLLNRRKFYDLLKKHFDEGSDYEALFSLLSSRLPDILKNNEKDLQEFLSEDSFKDILVLYEKAEGSTNEEKLEKLFRVAEESDDENIKIMSIHKSKGLGADHVFMVGLNEGIIPNKKRGNDTIESQRRLFYVGITRAQKSLHLFSNIYIQGKDVNTINKNDYKYDYQSRMWRGKASAFISELKLT